VSGRYIVTGAAGFIGSHLCERLLAEGASVVGVDSLLTGRLENLRAAMGSPRFDLVRRDINEGLELNGELAGIFHLASPASPVDYARYPIETLRVGAVGTEHMLRLARSRECPILLTSTSEVYGDPLEHPQKESYWGNVNPIGPRGCYDEAKRFMEAIAFAYHRVHGVQIRLVRIFNTYGPRMRLDDGRVVPNFIRQALDGEDLTVYGDGSQTRSFCYVDDMVEGLVRAMASSHHGPINLGNPQEMTILEFAERILALCGAGRRIVFRPLPQDDPRTRCPDISLAREILDWEPRVGLDEGLRLALEDFRSSPRSV